MRPPPHRLLFTLLLVSVISGPLTASAQDSTAVGDPGFGRSAGGQLVVTNSGFGIGAHLRVPMAQDWSATLEFRIGAVKDAREIAFFDRSGARDVPAKANYLLEFPLELGVSKRLFRSAIEDNFRPFLQLAAGPTFGWLSPYFEDENGNGSLDMGEPTFDSISSISHGSIRLGAGLLGAIGAHFGRSERLSQGVRLGMKATYYGSGVALLETGVQQPRHLFITPVLQFYLGRLW